MADNCGYWLYLGNNDVPKTEGEIKPIATDSSDSGSYDLGGRPVLDWGTQPLTYEDYHSQSRSVPRILTRAEKGQALTHLEMDFNLASLFHKANTSSVSASFASDEFAESNETPETIPYVRFRVTSSYTASLIGDLDLKPVDTGSIPEDIFGTDKVIYGPYLVPRNYSTGERYWARRSASVEEGTEWTYLSSSLENAEHNNWLTGSVEYDIFYKLSKSDKDLYEALNATREDILFYTIVTESIQNGNEVTQSYRYIPHTSRTPEDYRNELISGSPDIAEGSDVYFEVDKPSRDQEKAGLFVTFSYAPVKVGDQTIIQNPFQTVKVQHTTDEIRYKLANEQIPGTLHVREDFHVTGSSFVVGDSMVSGTLHVREGIDCTGSVTCSNEINARALQINQSASISQSLTVEGTGSFMNNVYISGNLYVHGLIYGNISHYGYNSLDNPNYATAYTRFGTQDTGSQSDARLKNNPKPISQALDRILAMQGYEFDWAEEAEKSGHDVGLIAQELQIAYPEAVAEGSDGYLRIDYAKLVPLLVAALRELTCQVRELQNNR